MWLNCFKRLFATPIKCRSYKKHIVILEVTMLPAGVLFLSAFLNSTLFIQVNYNVKETFICLSDNNVKNDTWPSAWKRMDYLNNGLYFYKLGEYVNKSFNVDYKLRIYFVDRNYVETKGWNKLYIKSCESNLDVGLIIFSIISFLSFIAILCYLLYHVYLYYK